MIPNKHIFCNSPWYELHIYWDGGLGICCQELQRLYDNNDTKYNIRTMSIAEWYNSDAVRNFRMSMFGNQQNPVCNACYNDEAFGGNSRRVRNNQKSVIFHGAAFEQSFLQSPNYPAFEHSIDHSNTTITDPVDIHVDFGNFCNLACKMCKASASSTIAVQEVKWGIKESQKYVGDDWSRDPVVWKNFKEQLISIPKLKNIHVMGGETLLTDRFNDLVDTLIAANRTDVCLSFVTNGTVFDQLLMEKLTQFQRVGIEVSIETLDQRNAYIRQGTNTAQVLANIEKYLELSNNSTITVTIRPVPSLLSVGSLVELLQYALNRHWLVKCNICHDPDFLSIKYLPCDVKEAYQKKYMDFLKQFDVTIDNTDYNASDPNNYKIIIKQMAEACLSALQTQEPNNIDEKHCQLVEHCKRWDQVYKLDAKTLYPELANIFERYGY